MRLATQPTLLLPPNTATKLGCIFHRALARRRRLRGKPATGPAIAAAVFGDDDVIFAVGVGLTGAEPPLNLAPPRSSSFPDKHFFHSGDLSGWVMIGLGGGKGDDVLCCSAAARVQQQRAHTHT